LITFSFTRLLLIKQKLEDQIEFVPVNEKLKAFILSSWDDGMPCPLATQGPNGRYIVEHAIQGETAATSHKDNQRAAHDRDIFQKIIILTDLLRAGMEFPIAVRYRSSHHHKREYQNRALARANAQYQASRD